MALILAIVQAHALALALAPKIIITNNRYPVVYVN